MAKTNEYCHCSLLSLILGSYATRTLQTLQLYPARPFRRCGCIPRPVGSCLSILSASFPFYVMLHRSDTPTLFKGPTKSCNTMLIHRMREILRPFLLRRLKVGVERTLPSKKEYVLYAPLTERQHEVYDAVVKAASAGCLAACDPAKPPRYASASVSRVRSAKMRRRIEWPCMCKSRTSHTTTKLVVDLGAEHQFKAKSASLHELSCPPATTESSALQDNERNQQHAPKKCRDTAAQGLLEPDLVGRAAHAPTRHGRRARRRERENCGSRAAP